MAGIAFGSSTIGSLYAFLTPAPNRAPMFGSWGLVELARNEFFALGLLVYVFARQGRSIA